jgi:hypothetical protein
MNNLVEQGLFIFMLVWLGSRADSLARDMNFDLICVCIRENVIPLAGTILF